MKTKSLVLIGVMIIALAAMAMPVMAADTAVYGTLSKTISISTTEAEKPITLTPGSETSTTVNFLVTQNCVGDIKVYDTMGETGKVESTDGYMADYYSAAYEAGGTKLFTKMHVGGTDTGGIYDAPATDLTDISFAVKPVLYTISSGGTAAALPVIFKQTTTLTDTVLGTDHTYRIPVTVAAACT